MTLVGLILPDYPDLGSPPIHPAHGLKEPHWSSPQGYIAPVPILTCKLTSWPDLVATLWTCPVITGLCLTLVTMTRPDPDSLICFPSLIVALQHHHSCAWWFGLWGDAGCHIWLCADCHTWWLSEIFFRCRLWKSMKYFQIMLFRHFNGNFTKTEWSRRSFFYSSSGTHVICVHSIVLRQSRVEIVRELSL